MFRIKNFLSVKGHCKKSKTLKFLNLIQSLFKFQVFNQTRRYRISSGKSQLVFISFLPLNSSQFNTNSDYWWAC